MAEEVGGAVPAETPAEQQPAAVQEARVVEDTPMNTQLPQQQDQGGEQIFTRIIGIKTTVKKTGAQVPIDDGVKTRYVSVFRWTVTVSESSKRKGRRGQLEKYVKHVAFHLHPTFKDPIRVIDQVPYSIAEDGYGSFDLEVRVKFQEESQEEFVILHPVMLDKASYENHYEFTLKTSDAEFADKIRSSTLQPIKEKVQEKEEPTEKKRRISKQGGSVNVSAAPSVVHSDSVEMLHGLDVDQLADSLYALEGPGILKAVEIVKKHQRPDSYVQESSAEFAFDIYTLNREAVVELWNLTRQYN